MSGQDRTAPGTRVLVVDDSVDTARMMKILLKREGYTVQTAHDGAEALELARGFLPGVVLLDLSMPGMTGQELAAALRQDETTATALIVAVSGHAGLGVPPGCDHLLVKPIDHDALMALLAASIRDIGADRPLPDSLAAQA